MACLFGEKFNLSKKCQNFLGIYTKGGYKLFWMGIRRRI
ncbi:hypothetical protein FH5_01737 [Priestia endophytica]|nr:hypothetical protein FH5_01737 [Priestia endophytica]